MKKVLAISAAIAALPLAMQSTAKADPLSWTEVGVGYNMADSGDENIDAFDIKASIGLGNLFHVQAQYIDGSEGGSSGFDFDGYEIRAGVHPSVGENTQVVIDVIYFDFTADPDFSTLDIDEDGYGIGFGIRHKMSDQFEVRAQADWFDGNWEPDGGSSFDFTNTTVSMSGRYYFTPAIFAGVGVTLNGIEALSAADVGGDVLRIEGGWSFGGDVL
jgi:hypothetical protein